MKEMSHMTAKQTRYMELWQKAYDRPKTHRSGIERRMRMVWATMSTAERKQLIVRKNFNRVARMEAK
jgi:hypothetical protein